MARQNQSASHFYSPKKSELMAFVVGFAKDPFQDNEHLV